MTGTSAVVAAFDFDGTLTTRDTVVPFLERVEGRARLMFGCVRQPFALVRAAAQRDRDRFKAIAVRAAFTGRRAEDVIEVGVTHADHILDSWMRPDTVARLDWHREQGHQVVLVSASLGAYLHTVGERLGAHAVLCTEPVVGSDGRYTGAMANGNCRGSEKVRRLRTWMAANDCPDAALWAYGDSSGDRELLAVADRAFFVKGVRVDAVPEGVG